MEVTKETFEKEVMQSSCPVLVDFYAHRCGPCRALAPLLEELERERKDIKLCKVNVDEEEALALSLGVKGIPTLALIKNGKEIDRTTGYMSKEKLHEFIMQ